MVGNSGANIMAIKMVWVDPSTSHVSENGEALLRRAEAVAIARDCWMMVAYAFEWEIELYSEAGLEIVGVASGWFGGQATRSIMYKNLRRE